MTEQGFIAFALSSVAMNAQTFNGVTVGGTADHPTIVNNSQKPILGYTVERIISNGISHVFDVLALNSIADGKILQPGGEHSALGMAVGIYRSVIDPVTGQFTEEGTPLRYELRGVLFADGTYMGWGDSFEVFSRRLGAVRSFARDTQYMANKYETLKRERAAKPSRNASVDMVAQLDRSTVTNFVIGIFDASGEMEADKALARFAALPDATKGGQQGEF